MHNNVRVSINTIVRLEVVLLIVRYTLMSSVYSKMLNENHLFIFVRTCIICNWIAEVNC